MSVIAQFLLDKLKGWSRLLKVNHLGKRKDYYSGSHLDEVQHYIARSRGTAVPCPYGCTLLGWETL